MTKKKKKDIASLSEALKNNLRRRKAAKQKPLPEKKAEANERKTNQ